MNKYYQVITFIFLAAGLSACSLLPSSNGGTKSNNQQQNQSVFIDEVQAGMHLELHLDGYYRYGLYPKSNVNDKSLIEELNALSKTESNGWYLFEGLYYAKTVSEPAESLYFFENGEPISRGKTYWFRCEPIEWQRLNIQESGNTYVLMTRYLIEASAYHGHQGVRTIDGVTVQPSNYEHSDVREWLNGEFFAKAFGLNDNNVMVSYVDNSKGYECNDTDELVYLPSVDDLTNASYGFPTSISSTPERECMVTDWARARGAKCEEINTNKYIGYYWSRSATDYNPTYYVSNINYNGYVGSNNVTLTDSCVRPMVTVKAN